MIPFECLGCTPDVERAFDKVEKRQCKAGRPVVLGRVVSLDRGFPMVRTADAELRAELAASIKKSADSIVAVGDWVALGQPQGHEKAVIMQVLARSVEIARMKRIGRERQPRRQVLAANVDTVLICQSLSGEGLDIKLLVRQMAAVAGCGAHPAFVLTKRDLVSADELRSWCDQVALIAPDVELLAVSVDDAASVERVRELCRHGSTALLLGESGVGKSSLVNALLGVDAADVGAVRDSDDRGRHTTVARRMLHVPGGGVIIDAPGLRTLQILDMDRSLRAAFPDIADAALGCRFRNCSHADEPGCAVRGTIAQARVDAYCDLARSDWHNRN